MLEKTIDDENAWAALVREVEKHGGFLARASVGAPPKLFASVEISVRGPGGEVVRVTGQVVQMTPNGEIAVILAAEDRVRLASARFAAKAEKPDAAEKADKPEKAGELWARWDELSKNEKIKLARQGNADQRRRVLKDRDQSLHAFVLDNPGMTGAEVAALIRSGLGAGLMKRISERSELIAQPAVAEALVNNPATPVPLAVQLIAKVPLEVARRIAKAGNLRPQIVQAARKRVIPG